MKIEPIRGWMPEAELSKADGCAWAIYVYPEGHSSPPPEGDIPVTIILRTPESIEDKREVVNDTLIDLVDVEDFDFWGAAKTILTAIGITEEE